MIPYRSDISFTQLKDLTNYIHLNITHFYHSAVDSRWRDENRCDNTNRLYFVLDGEAHLYCSGEKIRLMAGGIYLIPANLSYSYCCERYMEHIFVHFFLNIIPQKELLSDIQKVIRFEISAAELESVKEMFYAENVKSAMFFQSYLYHLLFDIMPACEKQVNCDIALYKKYSALYDYIKENLSADMTVAEICKNTGYSQRHLSYKFKTDTGGTIKSYITDLLLDRIKYMLSFTELSIKEIASELHFSDEFYFSRFFRKHMDISPRDYRKIHQTFY